MPEATTPLALVFLAVGVDLDAVAFLLVVLPLTVVARATQVNPGRLAILTNDALSNPIDGASLSCLLRLGIVSSPQRLLLGFRLLSL
eukprot:CAMPEP_0172773726 /NCGR_PEP_ID=MMETSP1074-20121228/194803_1 /TAXON_ID=2916 /ORGANISM="Ceratium fusus, Strain PA161109" /LENGTH=86 /DNA_ID=CAMNT_0013610041 /DNA_START=56 /DNA_END=316 /DNA_ORIENTATION=-